MMSPILGASMPPPHAPQSDPYDVPTSPMKALGRKESSSSRAGSKALTPARDSEADVEGGSHDAALTASTEPEKEERNGTAEPAAKEDEDKAADRHTPKDDEEEEDKPVEDKPAAQDKQPAEVAQKPAEAGPSRPAAAADADNGEVEIDKFEGHRINEENATIDIQVLWVNGEKTWESEWSLQHQVPSLIYKYWDSLGGRDAATKLDVYHVFRILKRAPPPRGKKNTFMYEVQWVGYRRTESSWEHETKIKEIAPDELIKYEAKNGAAEAQALKRGVARVPGRPRKKAKTSDE